MEERRQAEFILNPQAIIDQLKASYRTGSPRRIVHNPFPEDARVVAMSPEEVGLADGTRLPTLIVTLESESYAPVPPGGDPPRPPQPIEANAYFPREKSS